MEGIAQEALQAPTDSAELLKGFAEECRLRRMTSESIRKYLSNLRIFTRFLQSRNIQLRHVDRDVLRDFLRFLRFEKQASQGTLEAYFSHLSSFYDYLLYERLVSVNPVLEVRKRYLRSFKEDGESDVAQRKLISTEQLRTLVGSTLDVRDRAIIVLLAKTGIRRSELKDIDRDDIDWNNQSITLKRKAKRSNLTVFFDDECEKALKEWLDFREKYGIRNSSKALFVGQTGARFNRQGIYAAVAKWAERIGLHNPNSEMLEDHFSPHCLRHWFTTELMRAGMPREFVKELRGDTRGEALDLYYHIDKEELRRSYLALIPKFEKT